MMGTSRPTPSPAARAASRADLSAATGHNDATVACEQPTENSKTQQLLKPDFSFDRCAVRHQHGRVFGSHSQGHLHSRRQGMIVHLPAALRSRRPALLLLASAVCLL